MSLFSDYLYFSTSKMIKFSLFLRVFLQVIFAQNIISSDIFQLKYKELQTLVTESDGVSSSSRLLQLVEQSLSTDGALVSIVIFYPFSWRWYPIFVLWSHSIALSSLLSFWPSLQEFNIVILCHSCQHSFHQVSTGA